VEFGQLDDLVDPRVGVSSAERTLTATADSDR